MFEHLQIYDARERLLAGMADLVAAPLKLRAGVETSAPVERILLLRLERIGDLLMTLDAIHDARRRWPAAEIDLVVGSWNAPLAALVGDVTRCEVLDVPWLARERPGQSWQTLIRTARRWKARRYDLGVNFEPDIRGNLLLWLSGARRRVGYWTGGGGPLLHDAREYDPTLHVSTNARRLVAFAAHAIAPQPDPDDDWPRLVPPPAAVDRARAVLGLNRRPLIGLHVSGGRPSKQWHVDRFAAAAREIVRTHGGTVVLTGAESDQSFVDLARRALHGVPFVDASGALDLPTLAALLAELDVLVTSDTGPMHLAAAMDTAIVALFGPSDPRRYGPLARHARIVRADLWCSPCGRVRLPPERCRGRVPECMEGIEVDAVVTAAAELLSAQR
jgi:lipopolysaccharide heptosyltransferase II